MGVRVECNVPALVRKLNNSMDRAVYAVAEQALTDCNMYCRVYTGALRESSQTASDFPAGKLVWNTPYARRVYYTGSPSTDKNPRASLLWCEKAHDNHGKEWNAIAQKAFEKGVT